VKEKKRILVTGGAGFIGSNLVQTLLEDHRVGLVRVLDNFATGFKSNLAEFEKNSNFEILEGDIRDYKTCLEAMNGIDLVSHQAALGSVPRSLKDPITTNSVNISGTLNIFNAAVESGIDRVVFAASSSTYGDSTNLPKVEHIIGKPLSPYAITKYVNELYADIFSRAYKFNYIGLRYFNVFGPKQDPNGAYAAVIPLFYKAAIQNQPPTINGDGSFSRDFTYIENTVKANVLALFTDNQEALNQIYNVACGYRTDLKELWTKIKEYSSSEIDAIYGPNRPGDIPHSLADIYYQVGVTVDQGLKKSFDYYKRIFSND